MRNMAIGTFLILLETRNSMLPSMNYELNVQITISMQRRIELFSVEAFHESNIRLRFELKYN